MARERRGGAGNGGVLCCGVFSLLALKFFCGRVTALLFFCGRVMALLFAVRALTFTGICAVPCADMCLALTCSGMTCAGADVMALI